MTTTEEKRSELLNCCSPKIQLGIKIHCSMKVKNMDEEALITRNRTIIIRSFHISMHHKACNKMH